MPQGRPPSPSPPSNAPPTPAAMLVAHAEALAELATMLQHADRKRLEELVHGLVVLARRLAESVAAGASTGSPER